MKFTSGLVLLFASSGVQACDLCAVYRAADARGDSGKGAVISIAEQFIPYRTTQVDGVEVNPAFPEYVDSSITHFVLGYNFNSRFGVSVNVPLNHLQFKRRDERYSTTFPFVEQVSEQGTETGLGDMSLVGRVAVIQKNEMAYGFVVNLLAGVTFPTGSDARLEDEVSQIGIYEQLFPGVPHPDPLSHSKSSVHQHSLALGSGSFDGVFGLTAYGRWQRWFVNGQFQYYLHTEGESGFQYGDELIVSGGPGAFVLLNRSYTLSLQANAVYDTMARDEVLGKPSNQTGLTAWYLGPLLTLTWGGHFSMNGGVDVPLRIANNGRQNVPDYRIHGGLSWRF